MPKKKAAVPPLPPLSLSALRDVEDVERYARVAVSACNSHSHFNFDKASNILRTCVVTVFDLKLLYYEALPNFQEEWIHDIGLNTVSTALGFLPSDLREQDAREMDEILCNTLNAHSESRVIAAKEKQDAEAKAIEPVGKQIDDLRKKCRMTVEELADALDVTPRSVYRHLSGKADPRARQIAAYEKLFSQKLNKSVRLDTSVERQTSSKRQ